MKRILTLFLIFTLVLCSSFAAGQLYTMAFDSGWNNAIDGPYMGFHMLYHYGASVSENTTVVCGSLIDVDFGLKRFSKGDYIADIAMGFGPSFATDVNVNLTINGMIGPLFDIQKDKITDDSALGIGVGGTFALTLVPTEERKTRNPLGFTFGVMTSATINVDEGPASFISCKAYFGMSTINPHYDAYFYDVYDDVLFELYNAY